MNKKSAGILPYKFDGKKILFFLVHPGGPFWAHKDLGAWSIPKGEFENEGPLVAAKREFKEELGVSIDKAKVKDFINLSPQKLKSGKTIYAFALEFNLNPDGIKSNLTEFGWPEIDRGEWFDEWAAVEKINPGQVGFISELVDVLKNR